MNLFFEIQRSHDHTSARMPVVCSQVLQECNVVPNGLAYDFKKNYNSTLLLTYWAPSGICAISVLEKELLSSACHFDDVTQPLGWVLFSYAKSLFQ